MVTGTSVSSSPRLHLPDEGLVGAEGGSQCPEQLRSFVPLLLAQVRGLEVVRPAQRIQDVREGSRVVQITSIGELVENFICQRETRATKSHGMYPGCLLDRRLGAPKLVGDRTLTESMKPWLVVEAVVGDAVTLSRHLG